MKADSDAISRGPMDAEPFTPRVDAEASVGGDRMADSRLRSYRSDYHRLAQTLHRGEESVQALGVDAIVVRQQQLHPGTVGIWPSEESTLAVSCSNDAACSNRHSNKLS